MLGATSSADGANSALPTVNLCMWEQTMGGRLTNLGLTSCRRLNCHAILGRAGSCVGTYP